MLTTRPIVPPFVSAHFLLSTATAHHSMSDKPTNAVLGRIRRLLPHVRPARWDILGGLLAGVVYSITSGVGLPVMFKTTMPIFFGKPEDASPFVVKWAQYFFGEQYAGKLLLLACLGLPLVFAIRGAASFANRYLITRGGYIILESLRMEVFDRLQQLPWPFINATNRAICSHALWAIRKV